MSDSPDDFVMGRAAAYRGALISCWLALQRMEVAPEQRTALIEAFFSGIEHELNAALPSNLVSDDYVNGLHSTEEELKALVRGVQLDRS